MNETVVELVKRSERRARAEWPEERRSRYLIRQDVDLPISFDRSVLPDATPVDSPSDIIEMMVVSVGTPESLEVVRERWTPRDTGDVVPSDSDSVWRPLGHDICDSSGVSALMNCGYAPGERDKLSERWAERLNDHHLFESISDAEEFRALSNERAPEHAPFIVVRLYRRAGPTR